MKNAAKKLLRKHSMIFKTLLLSTFLILASCQEGNVEKHNLTELGDVNFAIAEKEKVWDEEARSENKTVNLSVLILGGTSADQDLLIRQASIWSEYGNIDFEFTTDKHDQEIFDIIVKIHNSKNGLNKGGTSAVGTDSSFYTKKGEASMDIWFTPETPTNHKNLFVLHEFGHALGLLHEHQHPERTFEYNKKEMFRICKDDKWEKSDCKAFKLKTKKGKKYLLLKYDAGSIMHYGIHKDEISGEFDKRILEAATELSRLDKIAIATLYPGRVAIKNI